MAERDGSHKPVTPIQPPYPRPWLTLFNFVITCSVWPDQTSFRPGNSLFQDGLTAAVCRRSASWYSDP